jgi:hypothetical protein
MAKSNVTYSVWVEGSLHDSGLSRRQAEKLRREFEAEGWNVRVLKMVQTVLGEMGVSV